MAVKSFMDVLAEVRGKPVLVANRGIPARRIVRTLREQFQAISVLTATDVDKTSPSVTAARELLLLGDDPRSYLERTFEEVHGYDEMVVLRDIPFESHCEHHLAPIIGRAHVA